VAFSTGSGRTPESGSLGSPDAVQDAADENRTREPSEKGPATSSRGCFQYRRRPRFPHRAVQENLSWTRVVLIVKSGGVLWMCKSRTSEVVSSQGVLHSQRRYCKGSWKSRRIPRRCFDRCAAFGSPATAGPGDRGGSEGVDRCARRAGGRAGPSLRGSQRPVSPHISPPHVKPGRLVL